jgi:hypothetical protein
LRSMDDEQLPCKPDVWDDPRVRVDETTMCLKIGRELQNNTRMRFVKGHHVAVDHDGALVCGITRESATWGHSLGITVRDKLYAVLVARFEVVYETTHNRA